MVDSTKVPSKKTFTENFSTQIGGHEGIGVVVKMGPGTSGSAVSVGDRVGIKWLAAICGSCRKLRHADLKCCGFSKSDNSLPQRLV